MPVRVQSRSAGSSAKASASPKISKNVDEGSGSQEVRARDNEVRVHGKFTEWIVFEGIKHGFNDIEQHLTPAITVEKSVFFQECSSRPG